MTVCWAWMDSIAAEYNEELGPNETITREQMAAILYHYAQYKGCDTTDKADLSKYKDAAQVVPTRWTPSAGPMPRGWSTVPAPQHRPQKAAPHGRRWL